MVSNSVSDDDRKFLTLTLVVPVLLFSVSLLLSYSCNHTATTAPQTNLTETTQDSMTEMEIITPPTTITTTSTSTTVKMVAGGVKIEKNPSESKLTQLGVSSWPKWEGGPSKFPWSFNNKETMYLLEGKVNVYAEGYDGFFEIGAGDLVEFPKGMKVTWEVIESVRKHYNLGE